MRINKILKIILAFSLFLLSGLFNNAFAVITINKTFAATILPLNATTNLTFTLQTDFLTVGLGINFTDNLPSGLQVNTVMSNGCGGVLTATPGSSTITLANVGMSANTTCLIVVSVRAVSSGLKTNTTTLYSSLGMGNTTTASLTVPAPPTLTKSFSPTTIAINNSSVLTFSVTNPNSVAGTTLNGVDFNDSLPPGLVVATPNGLTNTCGGTATAVAGSNTISLSGGSLTPTTNCLITVNVTSTTTGVKNNTTGAITSIEGGDGLAASATVTVVTPPVLSKAFSPTAIPLSGTSSLTFTVGNPNVTALTGIIVTDTLPAGLVVATPNGLTSTCGGTNTAGAGSNSISVSNVTLVASGLCTITVNVTGSTSGVKNNTTDPISSTESGTGTTASATLTVGTPPTLSKAFSPTTIPVNSNSTLTFTVNNTVADSATGVNFTDTLPAGLQVATPNGLTSNCNGSATADAGSSSINLSGGTLAASGNCTITVNVTGTTSGMKNNTTGPISSTEGGTGTTASATLTVGTPMTMTKAFGAASIPLNGITSLTFSLNSPSAAPATGIAFTDNLPAGLVMASPSGLTSSCNGTATADAGSSTIALTGGIIGDSGNCTISVNVMGTTSGVKNNLSGPVSSNEGGQGTTASATLTVSSPPTLSKAFGAAAIPVNGTTSLTFSVSNPSTLAASGINFTDTLPAGLVVATPSGVTNTCGGTATATDGSDSISLTGGTLAASSNCTISVNVTGTAAGVKDNTTGPISSTEGGTGTTASASLTVGSPLTLSKAFSATSIPLNGTTSLTFTVDNPSALAATGVNFADNLPAGLVVATPTGLASTCGGATTADAGASSITLLNGSLAANAHCTLSVNVMGTTAGAKDNTTDPISSTEGGTGNTASASLTVTPGTSPSITSANTTTFTYGVPGSFTVTAAGTPPPTLTLSGTLPNGITFNPITGVLSGVTTQSGTFSITITASNVVSPNAIQEFTIIITNFVPPDPTKDRNVTGLIKSQVTSVILLAQQEINAISQHSKDLHHRNPESIQGGDTFHVNLHSPMLDKYQEITTPQTPINKYQQNPQTPAPGSLVNANYAINDGALSGSPFPNLSSVSFDGTSLNALLFGMSPMSFWGVGDLSYGQITPKHNDTDHFRLEGLTVGLDVKAAEPLIIGLALSYITDDNRLDNFTSEHSSYQTTHQTSGSFYMVYKPIEHLFLDAQLGYGEPSFNNQRWSSTDNGYFLGTREGKMTFGSASISNQIKLYSVATEPFFRVDVASARLGAYTDQGNTLMGLTYAPITVNNRALSGGVDLSRAILNDSSILTPFAKMAFTYNANSNSDQGLFYTNFGPTNTNYSFLVDTVIPQYMGSLGLGLHYTRKTGLNLDLGWYGYVGTEQFAMNSVLLKIMVPLG